jgi:hypothetical protein
MRGHVAVTLEVRKGGALLGTGTLLPGHFADLDQGYRIGFAGMEQWSEIDFSRRNYRGASLAGFVLAALGLLWTLGYRVAAGLRRMGQRTP